MAAAESSPAPSNPLVAAILEGKAPRALRLGAARGVLPIPRGESLRLLVALVEEPDSEIRAAAASTVRGFAESELLEQLRDPSAPVEVLRYFGRGAGATPALIEVILGNPSSPDDLLLAMIPSLPPPLVDHLLQNLSRLIQSPGIVSEIEALPGLTPLQGTRIAEIHRHFLGAPARAAAAPSAPAPALPPADGIPSVPEAASRQEPPMDLMGEPAGEPVESAEPPEIEQESQIENAVTKIMRLNTAEKVQLAFKGTREERGILIKDSSKLVQQAVLDSPKLTDNEIESIARMRSVTEEILRTIAGNREWMKNYAVVHSLTTNPKTPVAIAMNLVTRLNPHDLKILVTDKNVAEVVRRQARKVVDSRNAGTFRR